MLPAAARGAASAQPRSPRRARRSTPDCTFRTARGAFSAAPASLCRTTRAAVSCSGPPSGRRLRWPHLRHGDVASCPRSLMTPAPARIRRREHRRAPNWRGCDHPRLAAIIGRACSRDLVSRAPRLRDLRAGAAALWSDGQRRPGQRHPARRPPSRLTRRWSSPRWRALVVRSSLSPQPVVAREDAIRGRPELVRTPSTSSRGASVVVATAGGILRMGLFDRLRAPGVLAAVAVTTVSFRDARPRYGWHLVPLTFGGAGFAGLRLSSRRCCAAVAPCRRHRDVVL